MSYKLCFHELALAEWSKLDNSIREPLKKKLAERLDNLRFMIFFGEIRIRLRELH